MAKQHERELSDFRNQALTLAGDIQQEGWPIDSTQPSIREKFPSRGPDVDLQNFERALVNVVAAIETYLRR
jgi:hypothetical protein